MAESIVQLEMINRAAYEELRPPTCLRTRPRP